jgi:phage-related protein
LVDGLKSSLAVIPDMIDSIKSQINSLKDDMSSLNMSSSSNSVSGSSTQQNAVANSSRPVIENHMHLYIDGKEVAAVTTPYSNKIQGTSFALAQRGLR